MCVDVFDRNQMGVSAKFMLGLCVYLLLFVMLLD